MNVNTVKNIADRLPDYVSVSDHSQNPVVSVKKVGISIARQTAEQATDAYLRRTEKEKLHLFDYKNMIITCGDNAYAMPLDGLDSLEDRQAAIISARMMLALRDKARLEPKSRYIGAERLSRIMWEHTPAREKVLFDKPFTPKQIRDVFNSAVSGVQHVEDELVTDTFVGEHDALALNPRLNPDDVRFKLTYQTVDEADLTDLEESHQLPTFSSRQHDDSILYQLPEMTEVTRKLLDGGSPANHQEAINLLDALMNDRCRAAVERELSIKLHASLLNRGHAVTEQVLGYNGYNAAVRARTIRGLGFIGRRIMQTGGSLDGSKTLMRMGLPGQYRARDKKADEEQLAN